jgi:hypothetical protein
LAPRTLLLALIDFVRRNSWQAEEKAAHADAAQQAVLLSARAACLAAWDRLLIRIFREIAP